MIISLNHLQKQAEAAIDNGHPNYFDSYWYKEMNPATALTLIRVVRLAKRAQYAADSSVAMWELNQALKEIEE